MFDDCCPECGHLLPNSKNECLACGGSNYFSSFHLKKFSNVLSDGTKDSLDSDIDTFMFDFD